MRSFARERRPTREAQPAGSAAHGRTYFAPDAGRSLHRLQHSLGNRAVQRLLEARIAGHPGDVHEREADRVADQVVRMPEPRPPGPRISGGGSFGGGGEQGAHAHLQAKRVRDHGTGGAGVPPVVEAAISSPGRPLDSTTREFMESRFGQDFGGVRVHTGAKAAASARAVNALAYTVRRDVVFGAGQYAPGRSDGRRLLAHELTHVVQQAGSGRATLQRRVDPEDVASEMVGRTFRLTRAFSARRIQLNAGDVVTVIAWSNASDVVTVAVPLPPGIYGPPASIDVPKTLLRPVAPTGTGISPYSAGVAGQAASVERGARRIEAERTRPGGPRPGEVPRLEGLQRNRERLLNRRLIQETMLNRFDPVIRRWTDHYNTTFGFTGARALDPDLVKSMFFQESQMGTAGQHLELVPAWEVRSRFNIGQVIDSAAAALLIMMREEEPALIARYHLQDIDRDRVRAQTELRDLARLPSPTAAQAARLAHLRAIDAGGLSFAEDFMWQYRAPGETDGFEDAVDDFFDVGAGTRRSLDYEFWIQTAIRWLFEKRRSVGSWAEAIRAYNGSGARARHYRDAVRGRAGQASTAERAGRSFVPGGI